MDKMKYIKRYKIFESDINHDTLKDEVLEIYSDFIDTFNFDQSPQNNHFYTKGNIYLSISTDLRFGEGVKVTLANNSNGGYLIKNGPSKGFSGIQNKEMKIEMEKAHNRCIEHFGFNDFIIASFYAYQNGGFSITYYTKSSFVFQGKEFDPQYLCGEDTYVRDLPLLKGYIYCRSSHNNIVDLSTDFEGLSMFCLYGGGSKSIYYNPINIISGQDKDDGGFSIDNSTNEQWVTKQWSDICKKYNIPVSNKSNLNMSRYMIDGDPTAYEFMDYLVDKQEDAKNYKKLPFTLKKR
jgi:hypothetical protein